MNEFDIELTESQLREIHATALHITDITDNPYGCTFDDCKCSSEPCEFIAAYEGSDEPCEFIAEYEETVYDFINDLINDLKEELYFEKYVDCDTCLHLNNDCPTCETGNINYKANKNLLDVK